MVRKSFFTILFSIVSFYAFGHEDLFEIHAQSKFYINQMPFVFYSTRQEEIEIHKLSHSLTNETLNPQDEHFSVIKEIGDSGQTLILEDESIWLIGVRYRSVAQNWSPKQRLKITYHTQYSNNIQFENVDQGDCAWGVNEKVADKNQSSFILRVSNSVFESQEEAKLILNNGFILKGPKVSWKVRDPLFIFHSTSSDEYVLWNLVRNEISYSWKFVGNEQHGSPESLFNIEKRLNQLVLGQSEVIKNVSSILFNCWAGLNDPKLPLGVFLFLGPTGVGKTELTKALTKELFHNPNRLIRFDMSQFVTQWDYTRLIGSSPGYVNHEEGGQLTEALKAQPISIVLLDEIEKAHPAIRKAFLPIFDEGYIADSKNIIVPCNRVIFIMTGNICSEEIANLFHQGYEAEEIIKKIEPSIMSNLSPEFYNRLTPVVFKPITPDLMKDLVDQKLNQVIEQLKQTKNLILKIDPSVHDYLMVYGYHPTLGVRPLKRLIQNKIISFISYAIIKEGIPDGSTLLLSYLKKDDSWHLNWS